MRDTTCVDETGNARQTIERMRTERRRGEGGEGGERGEEPGRGVGQGALPGTRLGSPLASGPFVARLLVAHHVTQPSRVAEPATRLEHACNKGKDETSARPTPAPVARVLQSVEGVLGASICY